MATAKKTKRELTCKTQCFGNKVEIKTILAPSGHSNIIIHVQKCFH